MAMNPSSFPTGLELLERPGGLAPLAYRWDVPDGSTKELAVLYLHGFASHQSGEKATFFRRCFLDAGLPFCSFDFQGHGASGGELRGLTLSRNLADTAAVHGLLKSKGYERLLVMGSSMGGFTGLWYGALHPDEVLAGVHIAPAVDLAAGFLAFAGPDGVEQWRREGVFRFANETASCELGWELIPDLEAHSAERLKELLTNPMLILQGQKDEQVPWKKVLAFATEVATDQVELHLFADGDHRLTDRKDRLWELIQGFLGARGLLPLVNTFGESR